MYGRPVDLLALDENRPKQNTVAARMGTFGASPTVGTAAGRDFAASPMH